MDCCTGFARFLLIIFNFIFWLSGAALLGVGIWILVDPDIEVYQEIVSDAAGGGDFLKNGAYVLIGFGAFIFIVGFCGCCGAIRKSKCLLGLYIFCLALVFAGELAAGIYVAVNKDDVENELEMGLKNSIEKKYNSSMKGAWDFVQKELMCCGGESPMDYKNSTWAVAHPKLTLPLSCCVIKDGIPVNKESCEKKGDFYHKQGCKQGIIDWINDNSKILIGVGCGLAALQIIGFICAICFCRHMNKEDM